MHFLPQVSDMSYFYLHQASKNSPKNIDFSLQTGESLMARMSDVVVYCNR